MKALVICILSVMVGFAAHAQSTASLTIMLSDIQSVKLTGKAVTNSVAVRVEKPENSPIQLLNRTTSQVKKILVIGQEYKKTFGIGQTTQTEIQLSDRNRYYAANTTPPAAQTASVHVLYQIDPL